MDILVLDHSKPAAPIATTASILLAGLGPLLEWYFSSALAQVNGATILEYCGLVIGQTPEGRLISEIIATARRPVYSVLGMISFAKLDHGGGQRALSQVYGTFRYQL